MDFEKSFHIWFFFLIKKQDGFWKEFSDLIFKIEKEWIFKIKFQIWYLE